MVRFPLSPHSTPCHNRSPAGWHGSPLTASPCYRAPPPSGPCAAKNFSMCLCSASADRRGEGRGTSTCARGRGAGLAIQFPMQSKRRWCKGRMPGRAAAASVGRVDCQGACEKDSAAWPRNFRPAPQHPPPPMRNGSQRKWAPAPSFTSPLPSGAAAASTGMLRA
jgi:hypothetical protein